MNNEMTYEQAINRLEQIVAVLEKNQHVTVKLSEKTTKLLKLETRNFFDVIREKLNFR